MTEHTDSVLDHADDLELITRLLNGQVAAPLLIMWSLPNHYERLPRPEGEAERDWERLQQRIRVDYPRLANEDVKNPTATLAPDGMENVIAIDAFHRRSAARQ